MKAWEESVRRVPGFARVLLAGCAALLALSAWPAPPAEGQGGAASESAKPALTEPLSREAVRELVSRLSDEEARRLLITQLDRAGPPEAGTAQAPRTVVNTIESQAARIRANVQAIGAAIPALPATLAAAYDRYREGRGRGHGTVVVTFFIAAIAAGTLFEWLFRRWMRPTRARLEEDPAEGLAARTMRIGLRLALELAALAIFAAGFLAVFVAFYAGHAPTRFVVLTAFGAVVGVRLVSTIARLLLAPRESRLRLLQFGDAAARRFYIGLMAIAAVSAVALSLASTFAYLGVERHTVDLLAIGSNVVGFAIALWILVGVRHDVTAAILRSGSGGALTRALAEAWPGIVAIFLALIGGTRIYEALVGGEIVRGAAVLTLALMLVLPLVDTALCRVLAALIPPTTSPVGAGVPPQPSLAQAFAPVLRRAIHYIVAVGGFLALAGIWQIDLFGMAQRGLGGHISGALLGIAITVLLAWVLWELARTAIDRRMQIEKALAGPAGGSRLLTLLPLLRIALQIAVAVVATLSVLAALGVNIVPLLAGASIIGVAIGFGSQSLVRDIVCGAFFLMDDAFRLGEYIEVGDAKGRVEKITLRSLFLRHHRGAVNVLPYGEIKRLRNNSRDWMILVMEFRLALDTDLRKVKKILKKIGEELTADPDVGRDLLEPLKSQGVLATDENALVVRAKFMARPGNAPFMIRRMAYEKIIKAFAEGGIRFAPRQVSIYVPPPPEVGTAGGPASPEAQPSVSAIPAAALAAAASAVVLDAAADER